MSVTTDLTITGKVAQFGRGAIADVSTKLMGQFATNLEELLESGPEIAVVPDAAPAGDSAESEPEQPAVRKIDAPEAEAVDLLEVAGTPLLQRIALPLGIIFVILVLRRMLGGD